MDIVWLNVILCVAAITGDATGYWIGLRTGHALTTGRNHVFSAGTIC